MSDNDLADDHIIKVSFLVSRRKEPQLHAWLSDKRFKNTSEAIRTLMRVGMATMGPVPNAAFVGGEPPAPRTKPKKRAASPRPAAPVETAFAHNNVQPHVPAYVAPVVSEPVVAPTPVAPVVAANPVTPPLVSVAVQAPQFQAPDANVTGSNLDLDQSDLSAAMDAVCAFDRMF